MTSNYGYFLKYTAFAAFLLGLYKREKNEKKLFPKIEKALSQVITCLQQFFAWGKKITISIYNAALLRTRELEGQTFLLDT